MELAADSMPETVARLSELRTHLVERVLDTIPDAALTGHPTDRLPGPFIYCNSPRVLSPHPFAPF